MMLGRLKKASGEDDGAYELELMPIAGGRVIDLETRLRKYNYTEHSKSDLADINDPAVRAEINAKQLEAFASDKRKRQVNRLNAARKLDEASIASPKLMQAHIAEGAATLKSRAELILEAGKTRNIPPHEPNALNLDEAYPIASMPCHALFHKFRSKDLLENAAGATDSGEVTFEPLTLALASLCLKTGTKPELNKRAQLIMYADALCKFLRANESKKPSQRRQRTPRRRPSPRIGSRSPAPKTSIRCFRRHSYIVIWTKTWRATFDSTSCPNTEEISYDCKSFSSRFAFASGRWRLSSCART